jgi:hypothetical protein
MLSISIYDIRFVLRAQNAGADENIQISLPDDLPDKCRPGIAKNPDKPRRFRVGVWGSI